MFNTQLIRIGLPAGLMTLMALPVGAQSFRVQCPTSTITHPSSLTDTNAEPVYTGPTKQALNTSGYYAPTANVNGAIKCQQVSGGDGYSTMADGNQIFMFAFGPLSGLADIAAGQPGTEFPNIFNQPFSGTLLPGDPAVTDGASDYGGYVDPISTPPPYTWVQGTPTFKWNGAVGLANDIAFNTSIYDISEKGTTVTVVLNTPSPYNVGDSVIISGQDTVGYNGTFTVTAVNIGPPSNTFFAANYAFQYTAAVSGLAEVTESVSAAASSVPALDGHVDPRPIMDVGVMNGNIPAPLVAIDEDDELFLTLTNVGMIMRPDLFEQHTIHFHGYPNASAFYDGVPDASVAINIGGSFTYYYLAPDAGTYFWHCHITPPEHLQMGMVGQLYVRPRQNRVPATKTLFQGLVAQQTDLRTTCNSAADILCSNPLPAAGDNSTTGGFVNGVATKKFAYNDGDGMSAYDVEYPLQIHGFDPNFHFVGMTFNPEAFTDMKDKYFLLNGRSYPDTVTPGPLATQSSDSRMHYSQPLPSIITIPVGQKALLRISDLSVTEYATLASLGIPMHVVGYNAKLLRDQAGTNMDYFTNSITIGGGESLDVILDTSCNGARDSTGNCPSGPVPTGIYYLYTPQLDHLSNDAENFGGLMTEVHVI